MCPPRTSRPSLLVKTAGPCDLAGMSAALSRGQPWGRRDETGDLWWGPPGYHRHSRDAPPAAQVHSVRPVRAGAGGTVGRPSGSHGRESEGSVEANTAGSTRARLKQTGDQERDPVTVPVKDGEGPVLGGATPRGGAVLVGGAMTRKVGGAGRRARRRSRKRCQMLGSRAGGALAAGGGEDLLFFAKSELERAAEAEAAAQGERESEREPEESGCPRGAAARPRSLRDARCGAVGRGLAGGGRGGGRPAAESGRRGGLLAKLGGTRSPTPSPRTCHQVRCPGAPRGRGSWWGA